MALGKQRTESEPSKIVPAQIKQIPKRYVVAAAIASILFLLVTMQFCSSDGNSVVTKPIIDSYGHALLLEDYNGTKGIVHDPECEKCRIVFERYLFKAVSSSLDSLKVEVVE